MDQNSSSRDTVSNKQTSVNSRTWEKPQPLVEKSKHGETASYHRGTNTTNQSNSHTTNAQTLPNHTPTTHAVASQRGNTSYRGRGYRGSYRGRANHAGRGYGRGGASLHATAIDPQVRSSQPMLAASNSSLHQSTATSNRGRIGTGIGRGYGRGNTNMHTKTPRSPAHFNGLAESPWKAYDTESNGSDYSTYRRGIASTTTSKYVNMSTSDEPGLYQQGSSMDNTSHGIFPASMAVATSSPFTTPIEDSTHTQISRQGTPTFAYQIASQTGSLPQLSPLDYLYAHNVSQGFAPTQQNFPYLLPLPMSAILTSPFGLMYTSVLEGLSVPLGDLEEHGYRTKPLSKQELEDKQRCLGCGKFWSKVRKGQDFQNMMAKKAREAKKQALSLIEKRGISSGSKNETLPPGNLVVGGNKSEKSEAKPILHCRFHPGTLIRLNPRLSKVQGPKSEPMPKHYKFWSCCNKPPSAEPCSGSEKHELPDIGIELLIKQWQNYSTPSPTLNGMNSYRTAVALDCEMGTSKDGDTELIRITMIDYFTTETLIDKLVFPNVSMQHLNTQYSGVTWDMLRTASANQECFYGRAAALEEVWKFVAPETIVVAHSGQNDLSSLRWRHYNVLDTYLLDAIPERERERERQCELKQLEDERRAAAQNKTSTLDNLDKGVTKVLKPLTPEQDKKLTTSETVDANKPKTQDKQDSPKKPKGKGPFSLQTLAKSRLGRDIQTGNKGHDSLEDALAARDLAHWHVKRILEGIATSSTGDHMQGQV